MKLLPLIFFSAFVTLSLAQEMEGPAVASTEKEKKNEVLIYPNPASDILTVKFPVRSHENYVISVLNIIGLPQDVESEHNTDSNEIRLRIKDLPTGYYLLSIQGPNEYRRMLKFLKK